MTEREFQDQVIELARLYGWRVAHFRPARTERGWRTPVEADGQGYPDLTLARPGDFLIAELKGEKGKLSPAQKEWLAVLHQAGVEVHIWKPSDFDAVHARLRPGRL